MFNNQELLWLVIIYSGDLNVGFRGDIVGELNASHS